MSGLASLPTPDAEWLHARWNMSGLLNSTRLMSRFYKLPKHERIGLRQEYAYEQLMGRKPPKITGFLASEQFAYNKRIKRFRNMPLDLLAVNTTPHNT
jgi:hypothetical protein